MKKIIYLFAFAALFVACEKEDSPYESMTVEEALNAGGECIEYLVAKHSHVDEQRIVTLLENGYSLTEQTFVYQQKYNFQRDAMVGGSGYRYVLPNNQTIRKCYSIDGAIYGIFQDCDVYRDIAIQTNACTTILQDIALKHSAKECRIIAQIDDSWLIMEVKQGNELTWIPYELLPNREQLLELYHMSIEEFYKLVEPAH